MGAFSNLLIHSQATLSRKEKLPACNTPVWVLARRSHRLPRAPTTALRSRLLPPRVSLPRSLRSRAAGATQEHGWSSSMCRRCWSSGSTTPSAAARTSWPRYCCGSGLCWVAPGRACLALLAFPSSAQPFLA